MIVFILWYLIASLVGLATFPLAFRLLPALADRGYALSRALGLLLWGYFFWLLVTLGVLRNDIGGLILTFSLVVGLGLWELRRISPAELREWWGQSRRLVLTVEVLFFLTFAGWAVVRAANPEIAGTEKPMELAFINAIMRSPEFPPHDPWLSGYAISYYYFGYVLMAMLARLTSIPGSVAFNLGISLVFALSATGAYAMVYDLLGATGVDEKLSAAKVRLRSVAALLGPFFVLIVSNLEGFLEVLHARGLFWSKDPSGQLTSRFWSWLDMKELSMPPAEPFSWLPTRYLWWWRASRVVQDYDLVGNWKEIIDEFPFFSYLLSDLHPHVLAMPFAFLAMAMALNLFLGGGRGSFHWLGIRLDISLQTLAFGALILGGLAFLNTWDFPIYVALFCAAGILRRMVHEGRRVEGEGREADLHRPSTWALVKKSLALGLALGLSGILLYLPFYLGFSSQAGGILPNLIYATRGAHLWVMFGALLLPLFAFLIYLWGQNRLGVSLRYGFIQALGVTLIFWFFSLLLGLLIMNLPLLGDLFRSSLGASSLSGELLRQAFTRRFIALGWVTLLVLLGMTFGLLSPKSRDREKMMGNKGVETHQKDPLIPYPLSPSHSFALLLILAGTMLVLSTEFFYLRDQFGWRMNTIFKFYYQAWLLWGIAAAYGTAVLLNELRGWGGKILTIGLISLLGVALAYPLFSLPNKTNNFRPTEGFTLDGTAFLERRAPDEMAAIEWLSSAPPGVVLEAVGGSYSDYARVSTISGQPTVLGWPGHESQWRGGGEEMGNRQGDIELIYRSGDWDQVKELLKLYQVRYVYVGPLEHSTYRVNEVKFVNFLDEVFKQGQVTIYEVLSEEP